MRALLAVLFAVLVLAGCADRTSSDEPSAPTSSYTGGPEDTLPLLGAWVSDAPWPATGRRVVLTLSDDNTYSASDACAELLGRWQLRGGKVELSPNDDGVQCRDDGGDPIELPSSFTVDGDHLIADQGDLDFTQR